MSGTKTISLETLKAHTGRDDLYVLISGKVYNVTKFLDEHPGGDEVILAEAGKDATEAFEDVGHSDEARDILKGCTLGISMVHLSSLATSMVKLGALALVGKPGEVIYLFPLALFGAILAYRFLA
ncbi:hypothetical protein BS47DRAFT_798116 [Hydnum rufescens UP504]|uniref:Cytochrome b5 heme-binding domain-containing protein n=1 Tax=Hydnum rufescens UP504 TaxID=1448309 RepID=A0A9P6DVD0_9AGAM|nr:hypothetical protein BS47DRAFT_798116 [Hydnum rufescens UP504]